MNTDDTAGFELTPEGASNLNLKMSKLYDCTYYVSFPCSYVYCLSKQSLWLPKGSTVAFWMIPIGLMMSCESDLMVPVRVYLISLCVLLYDESVFHMEFSPILKSKCSFGVD